MRVIRRVIIQPQVYVTASATVATFDEVTGEVIGIGPASTQHGVFFGRTDLPAGAVWRVTDVSDRRITVTPLAGGAYLIDAPPGTAGAQWFDWQLIGGPAPVTGRQNFTVEAA